MIDILSQAIAVGFIFVFGVVPVFLFVGIILSAVAGGDPPWED